MQYNNSYNDNIYSFVNNINTHDGGTHEEGVRRALTRVINNYARKTKMLKEKDDGLTQDDVKEGLTMIISCKHPNPQFEGQTKGRLGNSEVRKIADNVFAEGFERFLMEHPTELIAHQTVQHAARLLGVEQILINGAGMGHALLHALFGDLVKGHTVRLVGVQPQNVGQMPADGFAFTVRVGCQQHAVCVFGLALQFLDELFLALRSLK
jgi:hypothetical protein